MTCLDPYIVGIGHAFGCGRCYFCRIKRAKEWTHRIILETMLHEENSFVTLTYNDEHLPEGGTLDKRQLQLFFKRLRKAIAPKKIRYFAVGEYGGRFGRPHYHIALFGYPACYQPGVSRRESCVCPTCSRIARAWTDAKGVSLGFISVGTLEPASAAYVAKYATKSMEEGDKDVKVDAGRTLPFSCQSLKPGIGERYTDDIVAGLISSGRTNIEDIPSYLSHGKIRRPIGRYLRNRIRERLGISKDDATRYAYKKLDEEMRPLREGALNAPPGTRTWAFRELLVDKTEVKRQQIRTKQKIKANRKL